MKTDCQGYSGHHPSPRHWILSVLRGFVVVLLQTCCGFVAVLGDFSKDSAPSLQQDHNKITFEWLGSPSAKCDRNRQMRQEGKNATARKNAPNATRKRGGGMFRLNLW